MDDLLRASNTMTSIAERSRSIVAIIPARGGSKGIKDKNLVPVLGKPLIAHTIEVAKASPEIERVVVTTDSPRIAEVARDFGAEVPFLRPSELATDDAPGREVWKHAIDWFEREENYRPRLTMCLQPTSPLRNAADLSSAISLHWERAADWVISVCKTKAPSIWLTTVESDGRIPRYEDAELKLTQRQAISDMYLPNGAIFLADREVLMTSNRLYTERTFAYVMPPERSIDIDSPWELKLVSLLMGERD